MDRISIRTRLIIAFMGVVFLSLSGISLMLILANTRAAQQENDRQLMTIASYKGKAIQEWAGALTSELGSSLVGENMLNIIETVLYPQAATGQPVASPALRRQLRSQLLATVSNSRYYDELMLLDTSGLAVVSTIRSNEGQDYSQSDFFGPARLAPYIGTPTYSTALNQPLLYAAYPIYGSNRALIGILAGRAKTAPLQAIFDDQTGFREPGETYLTAYRSSGMLSGGQAQSKEAPDGTIIAGSAIAVPGAAGYGAPWYGTAWGGRQVSGLADAFQQTGPPAETPRVAGYTNITQEPVTGAYLSLPQLRAALVVEQTRRDFARSQQAIFMVDLSVILSSILLALYISLLATRSIATPITGLAEVAASIAGSAASAGSNEMSAAASASGLLEAAGGELEALSAERRDEIGVLGGAFHQMTIQLASLVSGLESIVAERTHQLATRSSYLEASADISRVATSILDPERLIEQAVELIRDRFDMYYVGLFLTSSDGQWAILRSASGGETVDGLDAGRRLVARGHRLPIAPSSFGTHGSSWPTTSMIGWCIANAQARIAQLAGQDEVRFATPELPETRSEAALPLRARGQVIGALSVQSRRPAAFDQASLAVLQTMADQLAIAIENAQLYAQSQQALEAERRAYTQSAQSEWRDWLRLRSGMTVQSTPAGSAQALTTPRWNPEMSQAYQARQIVQSGGRLALPIHVRGAVIGVINLTKPSPTASPNPVWTQEEISFLETIAGQLGVALDSARLYAETRQRAEQDRLVDEITSRMRATLDLRSVLETAAIEMRNALGLAEVEVRLGEITGSAAANGGADDE